MEFASALRAVRSRAPLVQCITNFVTVNDCANILLAAGASPTMARDIREVEESVAGVQALAARIGSVIAISGAIDVIADGQRAVLLRGGCAAMARITGSGCMVTTLIGAFCGAAPDEPFRAACAAMGAMSVCGERAEARRLQNGTGNATFRTDLIDAVFNLTEEQLDKGVCYEVYKG